MITLGISAYYHDSAAALVINGKTIAAAQEERFSRIKADASFPNHAIMYCLSQAKIKLENVDSVVFYDKPILTFDRLLETYLAYTPLGFRSFVEAIPIWVKEKIFLHSTLLKELNKIENNSIQAGQLRFGLHHHSHAASAFYPSPFKEAAVLVVDGVGEWASTSIGFCNVNKIELLEEQRFPHSLGLLYAAFTHFLGFKVNDGEYKVMGLAPYGEPRFVDQILENLLDLKEDGSFALKMKHFNFCAGLSMTDERFEAAMGGIPRLKTGEPLKQIHMDIARSIQEVTEEIMLRLARRAKQITGSHNLCLAGGVALNCVANGKILREGPFDKIWIQPASGDAGGALGAALTYAIENGEPRDLRNKDGMSGAYLGPSYSSEEIRSTLKTANAVFEELSEDECTQKVVDALANEQVIGWFGGRMEFGPRALGNRSIIADPCSINMQRKLNMKIKYRESFRPFAPAVLEEFADEFFDLEGESPYMLIVTDVKKEKLRELSEQEKKLQGLDRLKAIRSSVPAITHVDNSARVQTVNAETNPRFHKLLEKFMQKTGCPVLVNTSFNVRDEPIVCSPLDAYNCFMRSEMDVLAIENFILFKDKQV